MRSVPMRPRLPVRSRSNSSANIEKASTPEGSNDPDVGQPDSWYSEANR